VSGEEKILVALDAALALLTLGARALDAAQEVHGIIAQARLEKRDITDAELEAARSQRKAAENEWASLA